MPGASSKNAKGDTTTRFLPQDTGVSQNYYQERKQERKTEGTIFDHFFPGQSLHIPKTDLINNGFGKFFSIPFS